MKIYCNSFHLVLVSILPFPMQTMQMQKRMWRLEIPYPSLFGALFLLGHFHSLVDQPYLDAATEPKTKFVSIFYKPFVYNCKP